MGTIDDYLGTLAQPDRDVVRHVYDVVRACAGETEQGTSYGMPALMYQGKALASVMRTKKHFALYPFSGRVPAAVADVLEGFDFSAGTIRFQPEKPLPDDVIRTVVAARMGEIESPPERKRR